MEVQGNVLEKLISSCSDATGLERAGGARIHGLEEYRREVPLVQDTGFQSIEGDELGQPFTARVTALNHAGVAITGEQMASIEPLYRLIELAKMSEGSASGAAAEWGVFGAAEWRRGQYRGAAGALGYSLRSWVSRAKHMAPNWVAGLEDWELRAYCGLRYALQEKPTSLVTGSLTSVLTLSRYFERWREELSGDLRDGTLVRGPAQHLNRRFRIQAGWTLKRELLADDEVFGDRVPLTDVWAPLGGGSQFVMEGCENLFGHPLSWFDRGLNLMGLPVTLPLHSSWRGGLLWPGGTVLEFLPVEGGEPLWLDQLTEGRVYRLVMGMLQDQLVRVDTGQLVGIAGRIGELPLCVSLGHAEHALSSAGHRLHPAHLAAALKEVPGLVVRGFVGTVFNGESRFHLGLEGLGAAGCAERLDEALRALHSGYDEMRSQGRTQLLDVSFLPGGTLERFEDYRLHTGGVFGELSECQIVDEYTMKRLCEGWAN